jgi:hypothetical protein
MTNLQIESIWWTHRNKHGQVSKKDFIRAIIEVEIITEERIKNDLQNEINEDHKKFLQGFAYNKVKNINENL